MKLSEIPPPQDGSILVSMASSPWTYDSVLADVGSNARLDCDGKWVANPDSVDRRILADVRNGTGPVAPYPSPEQAGGYPAIVPVTACPDSDHDGMPDAWERRRGLNPRDPSDGSRDRDGNGYTHLEEYLNGS